MPPPARTTLKTLGQWSRPASLLILGVRPNSLETMTTVRFKRPVRSRSRIKAANAWSKAGIWPFMPATIWRVHVPAAVLDRDEPHAGGDQPARHQQPLAGRRCGRIRRGSWPARPRC